MQPGRAEAIEGSGAGATTAAARPRADCFRAIADQAPLMIWRTDPSMACDFFNQPRLEFTGRRLEQELGFGWVESVHPEDRERCLATFAEAFAARRAFTMEYRLRRHDGTWRWLLDNGRPCQAPDGRFTGYIGSCVDITDTRQALEQHEALLAELHHRVKNNAQATTSFLALQASRTDDPRVAAALRGAAMRVMLASLVQDRMFRLDAGAEADLGEALAQAARAALEVAGRPGLVLDAEVEPALAMAGSQATPLALVVNELVVNAARHAYPEGSPGRIRLRLRRTGPGRAELRVEDDGAGVPEPIRRQVPRHCLGLHLVPRLARQARATFRLEGPPGTCAVLDIRLNPLTPPG